jgi:hypothetical protein
MLVFFHGRLEDLFSDHDDNNCVAIDRPILYIAKLFLVATAVYMVDGLETRYNL